MTARPARNEYNTGPLGSGSHVVWQGEYFLSIAYERGFFWETLRKLEWAILDGCR